MAFLTTFLTVGGFLTNFLTFGIFSASLFDRMSFAVHMKILFLYNIIVLLLGCIQHNIFYMDIRLQYTAEIRRYYCTFLLWYVHVFRHARTASIALILYNRINSQSEPDFFMKAIEAARFPILSNALFLLVTTVYVSRYVDQLNDATLMHNRTECVFAYIRPFRKETTADLMVSNMPVFEHCVIITMLVILIGKACLGAKKIRDPLDVLSDASESSSANLLSQYQDSKQWPTSRIKSRTGIDKLVIVILNTVMCGLRDAPDSLMIVDMFPSIVIFRTFVGKSILDIIMFFFLAFMIAVMYLSCTQFRQAAHTFFNHVQLTKVHSDISMRIIHSSRMLLTEKHTRQTVPPVDDDETRASQGKKSVVIAKKSNENVFGRSGSVWSLDKAYFLNATKRYAIIEKF